MRTRTAVPTARAPPRAQEADSRRLAAPAAAQPQGELEVGRPQLPADARPLQLVRLGRLRPALRSALQAPRLRLLRRLAL